MDREKVKGFIDRLRDTLTPKGDVLPNGLHARDHIRSPQRSVDQYHPRQFFSPDSPLAKRYTPNEYQDFLSKEQEFRNLIYDWSKADGYKNRQKVMDDYESKYGFSNDAKLKDLTDRLRTFDSAVEANGIPEGYGSEEELVQGWKKWAFDEWDWIGKHFSPFKQI